MVGILLSYWGGLFSGTMLVSGRVVDCLTKLFIKDSTPYSSLVFIHLRCSSDRIFKRSVYIRDRPASLLKGTIYISDEGFSKTKHLSKNNTNRKTFCWIFGALLRNSTIIRMNRMEPANRGAMLLRALAAALGSVPTIPCTAAPLNANTAWWHDVCFTSVPVFNRRRMKGGKTTQAAQEVPVVSRTSGRTKALSGI